MNRLTATIPTTANGRPPTAFDEIKRDLDALETALRDEMSAEDSPPNVGLCCAKDADRIRWRAPPG